jgi:predicted RNase H-like nuclease
VYTFWSRADDLIGFGDIVWGYPTSQIPNQTGERVSDTLTHMKMKETTADWQYDAVVNHQV